MLPVRDHNPRVGGLPFVTLGLMLACAGVFLYQWQLQQTDEASFLNLIYTYGFIPGEFFANPMAGSVPEVATIFTSMFLHGGLLHLGGNMLYLWIFGDNIEDRMGAVRFIIFYLVCGVVAALTQGYMSPESDIPMIGASGAISGVLGAYLILYPMRQVYVFLGVAIIPIPAVLVLSAYMGLQLWYRFNMPVDEPGVAFWAHIGGFVAGVVLHRLFCPPRRA